MSIPEELDIEPEPAAQADDGPVQFSLFSLLILQAICAVFLALLVTIHIFAVVIASAATYLLCAIKVRPQHRALKWLVIDVMGGCVLPILCLYFDPGVIANQDFSGLAYLIIGFQMLALIASMAVGARNLWFDSLLCGMLAFGLLFFALLGFLLLPLSLLGLPALGLGLVGFVPFLTAYVFARRAHAALFSAPDQRDWRLGAQALALALGGVIAIILPALLYEMTGHSVLKLTPHYQWNFPLVKPAAGQQNGKRFDNDTNLA